MDDPAFKTRVAQTLETIEVVTGKAIAVAPSLRQEIASPLGPARSAPAQAVERPRAVDPGKNEPGALQGEAKAVASPGPGSDPAHARRGLGQPNQAGQARAAEPAPWSPEAPPYVHSSGAPGQGWLSQPIGRGHAVERVVAAVRHPELVGAPPWAAAHAPLGPRLDSFREKLDQGRCERLVQDAERAARAASRAVQQFAEGPARGVLEKINDAARTEPGGVATVIGEMRTNGRYAALRTEFDRALQKDRAFASAYEAATRGIEQYGGARGRLDQHVSARSLNAASVDGRLLRMEDAIGEAAQNLPGRKAGKSAFQELSEKSAEALRRAMEKVRSLFSAGPETGPDARSRPTPGMTP